MKVVGFFAEIFTGGTTRAMSLSPPQFAKKWIGNEKTLKMALMKKYSQSRTQWDWSVLESLFHRNAKVPTF